MRLTLQRSAQRHPGHVVDELNSEVLRLEEKLEHLSFGKMTVSDGGLRETILGD